MNSIENLTLFMTPPHPCSYLEDRDAKTVFIDPATAISADLYNELNEVGFRRSGPNFYKPHCTGCKACISTRVPIKQFQLSRKHRRILNKNSDLTVLNCHTINTEEHYSLYAKYISERHDDGDMFPPSQEQFQQFIGGMTAFSCFTEFRLEGKLIALAVADDLASSRSAVYTFFDPDQHKRSLGIYAILAAIETCRAEQREYLYLGYWIRECRKMSYKIDYRPIELLLNNRWQTLI